MNCASLESVKIPASVQSIGQHCFENCTKLKNVKLAKFFSSVHIEENAFFNCPLKKRSRASLYFHKT
jgi:hypothetical protein